ncbi:MAG: cupin domain-containing protein [Candidatus Methylomirabilaceae bacterium]
MSTRKNAIWLVVGVLIGMALAAPPFAAQAAKMSLKPAVIKVEDALSKGLTQKVGGFSFSVLAEGKTGGVELFSLTSVKKHYHPMENHFLYIVKGRAKGQIGTVTAEVGPGDLVVIPAGKDYAHKLDAIGSEPVVFLLFSSPPFNPNDIVWVEK